MSAEVQTTRTSDHRPDSPQAAGRPGDRNQPPVEEANLPQIRPLSKVVYLLLAGLFFLLGVLGIVLPGLPTTPFLLLTSYFLARSSPRLHRRLLESRLCGPILRDWQRHRAVKPRVKLQAAVLVIVMVTLLVVLSDMPVVVVAVVIPLACIGLLVIYRLPTMPASKVDDERPE